MRLNVQIDAAETLQMWGEASKRPKSYAEAMMGTAKFKNPSSKRTTNLIWGWRKLVQVTRGKPKFVDTYYKSLYHLIECRLEFGLLENSDKAIKSSLTEIENAEQRHSDMGGPAWQTKFADLKQRARQNIQN